ncbi:MAG TPA: hypothetical protein VHC69_28015 [Polyangiaceae bacterium]|nr:hypothetical protein [Polyangiaceae bacterium]
MPILELTTDAIKQECIVCGAVHAIPLRQGVAKAKKGPYALEGGDTLEVKVDAQASPQVISFGKSDFAEIAAATAEEVAAKLSAHLTGATADVDEGAVRIVSASNAAAVTAIEITGGTARDKLGFDGRRYGARLLGATVGSGAQRRTAPDTIDLPHCPECGSKECLIRTWDAAPANQAESLHAMHRRCVNTIAQDLKARGFSDPDAKFMHDAEKSAPLDILPSLAAATASRLPSARQTAREDFEVPEGRAAPEGREGLEVRGGPDEDRGGL